MTLMRKMECQLEDMELGLDVDIRITKTMRTMDVDHDLDIVDVAVAIKEAATKAIAEVASARRKKK